MRDTLLCLIMIAVCVPTGLAQGADARRDVIASAWLHPLVTDANIVLHRSDTRALIDCAGGPTLIRYPGVEAVLVDERRIEVERVGPNLGRVDLPEGTYAIELVAGEPFGDVSLADDLQAASPAGSADELARLAGEARPGDEVVIPDGIHRDWQAEVAAAGTADAPVIIRAQTPGGAIFQGNTRLTLRGEHMVVHGLRFEQCGPETVVTLSTDDSRVTQCQFFHCGNPRSTFGHIFTISMGADRNRVDHCYFTGTKSMSLGQRVSADGEVGVNNRLDQNTFRDIYRYSGNGQENIQLGSNQRDFGHIEPRAVVESNLFDHAWGDGEIISNKSASNIIRHNVAAHCRRSAFTLRGGDRVRFEGNIVVNCAGGVRVIGTRHEVVNNLFVGNSYGVRLTTGTKVGRLYVAADDALIAHNTIVDCPVGVVAMQPTEDLPFIPQRCRIVNNVITAESGMMLDLDSLEEETVTGNLLWPEGSAEAGTEGDDAIISDPRLSGAGASIRPAEDSPAVDAAVPLDEVTRDRWNRARPHGDGPDTGADEIGAAQAVEEPLLPLIPPEPIFAPELYRGEALFAQTGEEPLEGWDTDGAAVEEEALALTDSAATMDRDLPGDIVMSWEHRPLEWEAAGTLTLTGANGVAWALRWGGLVGDGGPRGTIDLIDATSDSVLAQGADVLTPWRSYRSGGEVSLPEAPPERWKRFALIKRADTLYLTIEPAGGGGTVTPVMLWHGHQVAPEGPLTVSIDQQGAGLWRNVVAWSREYTGDQPPSAPPDAQAEAHGAGRVLLTWGDEDWNARDFDVEIHRGADPNFEPSDETLVTPAATGGAWNDFDVQPGETYTYHLRADNVLGLTSDFVTVKATAVADEDSWHIFVRADEVAEIAPPMAVEVEDGRRYLTAAGAGSSREEPPAEGFARYVFEAPEDATCSIWARVLSPGSGSDSFWVSLDEGNPKEWGTGVHPRWTWSRIFDGVDLSAGEHTITVRHREPATKLESLLISSDSTIDPNG
ncbi:MAG: chondroitinase-B domain-containing protein [Armatimonadota bacterium]